MRQKSVTPYTPPVIETPPPRTVYSPAPPSMSARRRAAANTTATPRKTSDSALYKRTPRPSRLKMIKSEPPEIDLNAPMPPPSPTDDPLLLTATGSPRVHKPIRLVADAAVGEDQPIGTVPATVAPAFEEDLPPSDIPWESSSDVDEAPIEGTGVGEYTGRFMIKSVRTTTDPPSSATSKRRDQWGRPVSPYPYARSPTKTTTTSLTKVGVLSPSQIKPPSYFNFSAIRDSSSPTPSVQPVPATTAIAATLLSGLTVPELRITQPSSPGRAHSPQPQPLNDVGHEAVDEGLYASGGEYSLSNPMYLASSSQEASRSINISAIQPFRTAVERSARLMPGPSHTFGEESITTMPATSLPPSSPLFPDSSSDPLDLPDNKDVGEAGMIVDSKVSGAQGPDNEVNVDDAYNHASQEVRDDQASDINSASDEENGSNEGDEPPPDPQLVEITSADPRAAARCVAILEQHDYECRIKAVSSLRPRESSSGGHRHSTSRRSSTSQSGRSDSRSRASQPSTTPSVSGPSPAEPSSTRTDLPDMISVAANRAHVQQRRSLVGASGVRKSSSDSPVLSPRRRRRTISGHEQLDGVHYELRSRDSSFSGPLGGLLPDGSVLVPGSPSPMSVDELLREAKADVAHLSPGVRADATMVGAPLLRAALTAKGLLPGSLSKGVPSTPLQGRPSTMNSAKRTSSVRRPSGAQQDMEEDEVIAQLSDDVHDKDECEADSKSDNSLEDDCPLRPWTKVDWKTLDGCFTDERLALSAVLKDLDASSRPSTSQVGRTGPTRSPSHPPLVDATLVSLANVVDRFVDIMGGERKVGKWGDEWTRGTLMLRAGTLLKKQQRGQLAPAAGSTPRPSREGSAVSTQSARFNASTGRINIVEECHDAGNKSLLGNKRRRTTTEMPDCTPLGPRARPPATKRTRVGSVPSGGTSFTEGVAGDQGTHVGESTVGGVPLVLRGPQYNHLLSEATLVSRDSPNPFAPKALYADSPNMTHAYNSLSPLPRTHPALQPADNLPMKDEDGNPPLPNAPTHAVPQTPQGHRAMPQAPPSSLRRAAGYFFSYIPGLRGRGGKNGQTNSTNSFGANDHNGLSNGDSAHVSGTKRRRAPDEIYPPVNGRKSPKRRAPPDPTLLYTCHDTYDRSSHSYDFDRENSVDPVLFYTGSKPMLDDPDVWEIQERLARSHAPGLPLPPRELFERDRRTAMTPERPAPPRVPVPKDTVMLNRIATPPSSLIPVLTTDKANGVDAGAHRMVALNSVPKPADTATRIERFRAEQRARVARRDREMLDTRVRAVGEVLGGSLESNQTGPSSLGGPEISEPATATDLKLGQPVTLRHTTSVGSLRSSASVRNLIQEFEELDQSASFDRSFDRSLSRPQSAMSVRGHSTSTQPGAEGASTRATSVRPAWR